MSKIKPFGIWRCYSSSAGNSTRKMILLVGSFWSWLVLLRWINAFVPFLYGEERCFYLACFYGAQLFFGLKVLHSEGKYKNKKKMWYHRFNVTESLSESFSLSLSLSFIHSVRVFLGSIKDDQPVEIKWINTHILSAQNNPKNVHADITVKVQMFIK